MDADEALDKNKIDEHEVLLSRHKKERNELLASIQRLKHEVKGDKQRKKETTEKIAILEHELNNRHEEELRSLDEKTDKMAIVTNTLENVKVEETNAESNTKISKKQVKNRKKKEKKQQESLERDERIKLQEIENLKGERHKEQETLKVKLGERGLQIYEISSDGNCLYNAISHRLNQVAHSSGMSCETLRCKTADYILSHRDDFLPFLSKPDSGEPYSQEEFEQYCKEISTTSVWGGQPELRAMSCILGSPIHVVQADCGDVVIGDDQTSDPLTVVYHRHVYNLGEHYNSVTSLQQCNHGDDDGFVQPR